MNNKFNEKLNYKLIIMNINESNSRFLNKTKYIIIKTNTLM